MSSSKISIPHGIPCCYVIIQSCLKGLGHSQEGLHLPQKFLRRRNISGNQCAKGALPDQNKIDDMNSSSGGQFQSIGHRVHATIVCASTNGVGSLRSEERRVGKEGRSRW